MEFIQIFRAFSQNNFPKKPILLRDMKSLKNRKDTSEKPQKQQEIIDILHLYPER